MANVIHILDDENCWLCGAKGNLTTHHAIPKHLKPKRNVLIPICLKCHDIINSEDITCMTAHVYKLNETLKGLTSSINKLKNNFEAKK
jgi:5-methylcytosine-specific restriction endonuclease McrA